MDSPFRGIVPTHCSQYTPVDYFVWNVWHHGKYYKPNNRTDTTLTVIQLV